MKTRRFKTGHIIKHKTTGWLYKLIGKVANDRDGAHALYQVVEDGWICPYIGCFPHGEYEIIRIPRPKKKPLTQVQKNALSILR